MTDHLEWYPMSQASKNENTEILLITILGITSAFYSPGRWSDETPDHPKEYDGPVWVCLDDSIQFEIEETPEGDFCEGVFGWLPRDALPDYSEPDYSDKEQKMIILKEIISIKGKIR